MFNDLLYTAFKQIGMLIPCSLMAYKQLFELVFMFPAAFLRS